MITLAVDCMGGDHGPGVTFPACRQFLSTHPDARLLLVGLPEAFANWQTHERAEVVHASEVVTMDDPVEVALRRKKNSSMRVAIQQVKDGKAQAAVSAGNTGALMAVSRYLLKTMDGIDRPAIASQLPNDQGGATTVLDLGANVDCQPEHLLQFAVMGSALVTSLDAHNAEPSVGLLNIGEEAIKGSEVIKRTGELLRQAGDSNAIRFVGNVEGNDIFKGTVDIVVCDGFVGNVTLKAIEGLGRFVKTSLNAEFRRSPLTMLGALISRGALKNFGDLFNPSRYNGAALLGLRGLVFKSHGGADAYSYGWAIKRSFDAAKYNVLEHISEKITELMPRTPDPEAPGSITQ